MWLAHTKTRAARAWEGILLDEIFLFAGGVEGAWSNDEGWMKSEGTKANPCLHKDRRNTSSLTTGDDRRERTGVISRDGKVRARQPQRWTFMMYEEAGIDVVFSTMKDNQKIVLNTGAVRKSAGCASPFHDHIACYILVVTTYDESSSERHPFPHGLYL